jgi:hypothetical protein
MVGGPRKFSGQRALLCLPPHCRTASQTIALCSTGRSAVHPARICAASISGLKSKCSMAGCGRSRTLEVHRRTRHRHCRRTSLSARVLQLREATHPTDHARQREMHWTLKGVHLPAAASPHDGSESGTGGDVSPLVSAVSPRVKNRSVPPDFVLLSKAFRAQAA